MAEKLAEPTTSTPLAATPTAGQARIEDVRPILIVADDEDVFRFDLAIDGRA
jgi:hypothetical protein